MTKPRQEREMAKESEMSEVKANAHSKNSSLVVYHVSIIGIWIINSLFVDNREGYSHCVRAVYAPHHERLMGY